MLTGGRALVRAALPLVAVLAIAVAGTSESGADEAALGDLLLSLAVLSVMTVGLSIERRQTAARTRGRRPDERGRSESTERDKTG